MPKSEEFFGVFPLKGLVVRAGEATPEIFNEPWSVVSASDVKQLDNILSSGQGFKGNLEMIARRLQPSAFLLVREYMPSRLNFLSWRKLSDRAEQIASAICISMLTYISSDQYGSDRNGERLRLPTPIWIPKLPEHCELPLICDRTTLRMVGHSSEINWPKLSRISGDSVTNASLKSAIASGSPLVRGLVQFQGPPLFSNASRAIVRSFNCTSIGQFCAQSLGALDILFGENDSTRWKEMKRYATTLCGSTTENNIERLFDIRHKFVHRHLEPADASAHIKALAVVCSCLPLYYEIVKLHGAPNARLLLEARDRLQRAGSSEAAANVLPLTPTPDWAEDWLAVEVYQCPHRPQTSPL